MGAAWALPVITAATATPLAAASAAAQISISTAPQQPTCGTFATSVISVTEGASNTPAANTPVQVTLGGGMTFPDGTTTKTLVTDASGSVNLTGATAVQAGPNSGSHPITATATTLGVSAAGTLTATDSSVYVAFFGGDFAPIAGVSNPVDIEVAAGTYWVRDTSGVIQYSSGAGFTPIAGLSGATSIDAYSGGAYLIVTGPDGRAYVSLAGGAFQPIAGSTTIEEIGIGAGYYWGRDAAGAVYRASITASPLAWTAVPTPVPMADIDVPDLNGADAVALGENGIAYRSIGGAAFTAIPGTPTNIVQIDSGGFSTIEYFVARDADGNIWRATQMGSWSEIAMPAGIEATGFSVYSPDGNYVIAIGSDGNAYESYGGAPFTLIEDPATGTAPSNIVQVGVGFGVWGARDADGNMFWSYFNGAWTAVGGLTEAIDLAVYPNNGGYFAAIGPVQATC